MALVARLAVPLESAASTIAIRLDDSGREMTMHVVDPFGLTSRADDETTDGVMTTTTPAFVRLVYGRLGPDHPASSMELVGAVTLEQLRTVFPGF